MVVTLCTSLVSNIRDDAPEILKVNHVLPCRSNSPAYKSITRHILMGVKED